jgi:hypothetical protein
LYNLLEALSGHPRNGERFDLPTLFVHGVLLGSVFRKTVVGEEQFLICKTGAKRPGTISELLDKLIKTLDITYGKYSMVVNHPSSLSKGKKMPPRRYNTPWGRKEHYLQFRTNMRYVNGA